MEWAFPDEALGLVVALGCGLLIGVEREQERQHGEHAGRRAAGVRTCGLLALAGGISALLGPVALGVVGGFVALIIASGYHATRAEHPGLTTEVALLVTSLIGALAMQFAPLAAALAVTMTLLLQSKAWLHRFARETLSETELNDALLLLASALIVLPVLPDGPIGPFEALNLRKLWLLVVLVMAINAAGYAAVRLLGPRLGLPLTGLAGGFVSSSATIGGMAQRSRQTPALARACAAAGMASNISTLLLIALLLGAGDPTLLRRLGIGLLLGGCLTVGYAVFLGRRAPLPGEGNGSGLSERPFHFGHALSFAALIAVVLLISQFLSDWLGSGGALLTAAAAGFADAHAVTISMAELAAGGQLTATSGSIAVLLALTTNTVTKALLTVSAGHTDYRRALLPGLALMLGGVWLGWWLGSF
ncbi:MAG: MgtC/SapB family protein [Xanthomonadales bacterium]|nr:MgtC/SapB family protein [Xanthomonadales bacterium]